MYLNVGNSVLTMRYLLLLSIMLCCFSAWSDSLTSSAATHGKQLEPQGDQPNEQKHLDKNPAEKPPISIVVSPTINAPSHRNGDEQGSGDNRSSRRTLEILGSLITVAATIAIAIFTFTLSRSTKKLWQEAITSGKTAKDAADAIGVVASAMASNVELLRTTVNTNKEIAARQKTATELQLRAFVFPIDLIQLWEQIPGTELFAWRFSPTWKNTGNTPTKRLVTHTSGELRDSPFPAEIIKGTSSDTGFGLIPPGVTVRGGQAPGVGRSAISPEDILDIQSGKKAFYLFGWAKYFDVFEGTPMHITRFCWRITCVGDPFHFVPNSTNPTEMLRFNYLIHDTGNCADEECEQS